MTACECTFNSLPLLGQLGIILTLILIGLSLTLLFMAGAIWIINRIYPPKWDKDNGGERT